MSKKTVSRIIGLFLSALLGICAISLPVFILSMRHYNAPLFPIIRTGVEGMTWLTFVILFVGGIVLGLIFSIQPVLLGMFSMAAMPVFSILEMIVDPNSHNLFPIEFIIYAVVSMVTVGGVFLGCRIRYKIFKNKA
jgi:hypothetical protein